MNNRFLMICQAISGLAQAWIIKTRKNVYNIKLPAAGNSVCLDKDEIRFVIWFTGLLVKIGAIRTGRKCFFRAFILASVLRRWGMPVVMNIGLYNIKVKRKPSGHCWLTLKGDPFEENDSPNKKFPIDMGYGANGVHYWAGHN